MKIDTSLITLLKLFSTVNPHLVVEAGSKLKTVNRNKTCVYSAELKNITFDKGFATHDLPGVLKILACFDDPTLSVTEKNLIVSDMDSKQRIALVEDLDELVYELRDANLQYDGSEIVVDIPFYAIQKVLKASSVNDVEDILISSDGDNILLSALDKEQPTRVFSTEVGKSNGAVFKAYFRHSRKGEEKLNILSGVDHSVTIFPKFGLSVWETDHPDFNLKSIIGIQAEGSEFE